MGETYTIIENTEKHTGISIAETTDRQVTTLTARQISFAITACEQRGNFYNEKAQEFSEDMFYDLANEYAGVAAKLRVLIPK